MSTTARTLSVLSLVTVAACGGGGSTTSAPGGNGTASPAATGARQGQRAPGASGLLAAISGQTLQVQGTTTQTAVTYTAATTITQTVPATAAAVHVGLCAQVRGPAPAGATSAPPSSPPAVVAATAVILSPAVNGHCTAGFAGGRGAGADPNGSARQSPGPRPSRSAGALGRRRPFGGGAMGEITAVNAAGFTINSARPNGGATPSSATALVTVTTAASTTYDLQQVATAAALKVGLCVTARGAADSVGAITATSLALRPAVSGTCTGGAGGPGA